MALDIKDIPFIRFIKEKTIKKHYRLNNSKKY